MLDCNPLSYFTNCGVAISAFAGYPFSYFGNAPKRYIVTAGLIKPLE